MLGGHVSDQLAAYLDGALSSAMRSRVESHVARCERCREELEQNRLGRAALEVLPLVEPPPGLWESIQAAADHPATEVSSSWVPLRWAAAALLLIAAGSGFWMWSRSPAGSWEVTALDGSPTAGSQRLSGRIAVPAGQWVETDTESRARIAIGTIGAVQVEPKTSVHLLSTGAEGHRLALRNGEIKASISAPPRLFFVDTPAGTAIDLGCEYRLQCDRSGAGMLTVTAGWVALEWKGREVLVPGGASCRMYAGHGPGTPWFVDSAREFAEAVERFDRVGREALPAILTEARARDTLTLWHLLAQVDGQDRIRICDRMAQLAPPPSTVTRDRVLQLDPTSLKLWREELAWIW